jgi:hypothetical protein
VTGARRSAGFFFGFECLLDDSLPEGCVKFLHGDGRVDVFRIEGETATKMVLHPGTGEPLDPDSVAGQFWADVARKKKAREEAAMADTPLEHFEAVLRMVWTEENLLAAGLGEPLRFGPQDLDEWLAEDNPHRMAPYGQPGVLEALGLR